MELLAPIGNFDSLKVAINNGANAVYFGVNNFNARNNIDGFTLENVKEIVEYCHLRKVKAYMAINILFKDEELQSALDVVFDAHNFGVDAFIIQDIGFARLIKELYPMVVIHAKTILTNCNFAEGYTIDLGSLTKQITFINCFCNGTLITADNYDSLLINTAGKTVLFE